MVFLVSVPLKAASRRLPECFVNMQKQPNQDACADRNPKGRFARYLLFLTAFQTQAKKNA